MLGVAFLVAAAGLLIWFGWMLSDERIAARGRMPITATDINLPARPVYIKRDIAAEILRDGGLVGKLDALQPDAAERLAQALALNPWIHEVREVRVRYPGRVQVDLVYRRPVLMVEVPHGVYPVSLSGVLLPSEDFSSSEAARYPRLSGIASTPAGPVGTHWGDTTVEAAARLAGYLQEEWVRLGLEQLQPAERQPLDDLAGPQQFVLLTKSGDTRIVWGSAPGQELPGELTAEAKMVRLRRMLDSGGTLDVPETVQLIDLRPEDEPLISRSPRPATAELDNLLRHFW
jgi:hypothetical protein